MPVRCNASRRALRLMKTELIDVSPTRKEIKIEIEAPAVRAAYDRISDRYAKLANVPGFRRGHAPRSVVRTRFKSEIRGEVMRELVPEAITEAIGEHELNPIGEPDVHLDNAETMQNFGEEPISVQVSVEVLPTFDLGEYKGIEVSRRVRPVTETDIDQVIKNLRENSASLLPVEDRGAEDGDIVSANFHGKFLDASGEEDINVEDVEVVLGGEGVQPEFNDNLLGSRVDDEKTFMVNYPDDFSSKGLAGKKVEYHATVTGVRVKELPELDDEWARSLGDEFNSLEELRASIREDLEGRANAEADHHLRNNLIKSLVEAHRFEVPQTLIEHQASHKLESVVRDMIARGIDPRNQSLNWEGARAELKGQAEEDIRASMLLERIADEEQIEVTDEEIEAEMEAIANASQQSKEQVRAALTKEGGERSIASRLRNRKALDLLVENARIAEAEWIDERQETEARSQESE
jgi:trigger factor